MGMDGHSRPHDKQEEHRKLRVGTGSRRTTGGVHVGSGSRTGVIHGEDMLKPEATSP